MAVSAAPSSKYVVTMRNGWNYAMAVSAARSNKYAVNLGIY